MRCFLLALVVSGAISSATQAGEPSPRDVPVTTSAVTQGSPGFPITAPTRAVFSFFNPGDVSLTGTLVMNRTAFDWSLDDVFTFQIFGSEADALSGGSPLFTSTPSLSLNPDWISTGNGENLNFLGTWGFQGPVSGFSVLWGSISLTSGGIAVANTPDPVGGNNYLVDPSSTLNLATDLGFPGSSWAVRMDVVPAPGATAVLAGASLFGLRRRSRTRV